jgi:N-methylhydantoinase B
MKIDALTVSVISSRLKSIAEEMGVIMGHTARSPIFTEAHDYACSIFDWQGRLVAEQEAIPILLASTKFALRSTIEFFNDQIFEDDILVLNDPFFGGNHIPDWTLLKPVFENKQIIAWVANKAHQIDSGGPVPGNYNASAKETYQEGILIPPIKLYERGNLRPDVLNLLKENIRFPEMQTGDLNAIIGSLNVGQKRIRELLREHESGTERFKVAVEGVLKYSESLVKQEISKLRPGTYIGQDAEVLPRSPKQNAIVRATVKIRASEIIFDFTGSSPQVDYFVNSSYANTCSAVYVAFATAVSAEIPRNDGFFLPVKIVAPKGTVVNPSKPAPTTMCTLVLGDQIIEACWRALSLVIPRRISSAWGTPVSERTTGLDPRTNNRYVCVQFLGVAGGGAIWGRDGDSAIGQNIALGSHLFPSIEMQEVLYPQLTLCRELMTDSGGPGRWRGGLGTRYALKAYPSHRLHLISNPTGVKTPIRGILGAPAGNTNNAYIRRPNGRMKSIVEPGIYELGYGDLLVIESQGGGGVGDPYKRNIEFVHSDVINGYVSIASARDSYGVIINPQTHRIRRRRKSRSKQRDHKF